MVKTRQNAANCRECAGNGLPRKPGWRKNKVVMFPIGKGARGSAEPVRRPCIGIQRKDRMNRRDLLKNTAALGFATTISTLGILARPVVAEARAVREQPPEKASSQAPPATKDKKLCPVCGMKGDPAITSVYKGQK